MLEGLFFDNCFDVYFSEEDKKSESPNMEVYVHPNEMSGWAPKTDMEKLKAIVENNEYTSNVELVYICEVYNLSDDEYETVLKESETEIVEWLKRYKAHYKRKVGSAISIFNKLFGLKRLSTRHLSYKDYVAENYIKQLLMKYQ